LAAAVSGGCGGRSPPATGGAQHHARIKLTAASGPLTLVMTVTPARTVPGEPVSFIISIRDRAGTGALGYQLDFGDGASSGNVTPLFCRALPALPEHESWTVRHRYRSPGRYRFLVHGHANCSPYRITATADVGVGG
jgi:PKD domain